jgi:hypothetical protein
VDTISFTVPTTGTYLVEVNAFSAATYALTVSINGVTAAGAQPGNQPELAKPIPTAPILPVSSVPEQQAGLPPAPQYSFLYLPLLRR